MGKKSGYDLFYIVNYLGNVLCKIRLDIRVERGCICVFLSKLSLQNGAKWCVIMDFQPHRASSHLSIDKEKVVLTYSINLTESVEFRDTHARHV